MRISHIQSHIQEGGNMAQTIQMNVCIHMPFFEKKNYAYIHTHFLTKNSYLARHSHNRLIIILEV